MRNDALKVPIFKKSKIKNDFEQISIDDKYTMIIKSKKILEIRSETI